MMSEVFCLVGIVAVVVVGYFVVVDVAVPAAEWLMAGFFINAGKDERKAKDFYNEQLQQNLEMLSRLKQCEANDDDVRHEIAMLEHNVYVLKKVLSTFE